VLLFFGERALFCVDGDGYWTRKTHEDFVEVKRIGKKKWRWISDTNKHTRIAEESMITAMVAWDKFLIYFTSDSKLKAVSIKCT